MKQNEASLSAARWSKHFEVAANALLWLQFDPVNESARGAKELEMSFMSLRVSEDGWPHENHFSFASGQARKRVYALFSRQLRSNYGASLLKDRPHGVLEDVSKSRRGVGRK